MFDTTTPAGNETLPRYGERPHKPGLYLGLFHGRHTPNEQMDDWGFAGPTIGPLRWCHTTYATHIKIEFECAEDASLYFGQDHVNCEIDIAEDLLVFDGKYYGDWTVFYIEPDECARPVESFRPTPRRNYHVAHRKSLRRLCAAGILPLNTAGKTNGYSPSNLD
jgi:hypothetical protein